MATFNEFWTNARNRIAGWLADPTDAEQRALAVREYSNNQALAFFEGAQSPVLKIDARTQIDDNLFVNYPEMIVDKGVSFLFGDGLAIAIDDEGVQRMLNELWPEDTRSEDLQDLRTDKGILKQ